MYTVVYAALVCEKFGLEEKALDYLEAGKGNTGFLGIYKVLPASTSVMMMTEGRIYASQGKTDEAVAGTTASQHLHVDAASTILIGRACQSSRQPPMRPSAALSSPTKPSPSST